MLEGVATRRVRAYVGIGANVGDPRANLRKAVHALAALPGVTLRGVSPLYSTKPVGGVDQPDFLNAVVALDVPAGPDADTGSLALLAALKSIEQSIGRIARQRWGPREVDLDLLLFGRHEINVERPDRPLARRPTSAGARSALRPGAAERPRSRPAATRLARNSRDRTPAPGRGRGTRRRPRRSRR